MKRYYKINGTYIIGTYRVECDGMACLEAGKITGYINSEIPLITKIRKEIYGCIDEDKYTIKTILLSDEPSSAPAICLCEKAPEDCLFTGEWYDYENGEIITDTSVRHGAFDIYFEEIDGEDAFKRDYRLSDPKGCNGSCEMLRAGFYEILKELDI